MTTATRPAADLKTRIEKTTRDGLAVVVWTMKGPDTIRAYTYATWTDYTTDLDMTHAEARESYSGLTADGWKAVSL